MIVINNVSKTFVTKEKKVEAVRNVSLRIDAGDIFGIIGFSGAGKSTLVRCINMLERPTEGHVFFDGKDMTILPPAELRRERKKIGMIFQHFNLMASRTVADNVAFPIRKAGLSKDAVRERTEKLLKYVDLVDRAGSYPSELSGGQKQRVAIARALASEPKVLLCDEATSALDPQTTRDILELLAQLNHELGITIVVITHEMNVIKRICTKVAVMEDGQVVEQGDVFDIFASPEKEITKAFLNTTSNLSEIYHLIDENDPIVRLSSDEVLTKLTFRKATVSKPLISEISARFNLTCNILFSDVEILHGLPLGGTVSVIRGEPARIRDAFSYLKTQDVIVEVLKGEDVYN